MDIPYIHIYPVYTQRFSQYTQLCTNTFTRFSRTSNISLSVVGSVISASGRDFNSCQWGPSIEMNGEFYSNLTAEMRPH